MPPEDDSPQPAPESPSPAIEAPAPAVEPVTPPAPAESVPATETAPASAEATADTQPITQTGPQGPLPFSTTDDRQENQVAQIPPNEPTPAPEPIASTPVVTQPEPPPPVSAPVILAPVHAVRDLLTKARVSIQDRKRKKRDKIMLALTTKTKITNDEVEKLLHVSDATATRYLSALEKEGKIKQVGKTGHGVVYSKI